MDTFLGFEVHMDYEGQKLSERLFHGIIILFGVIGWIYGYMIQDFFVTVLALGAGFVLASLVSLPPWPIYRCNPLNWISVQGEAQKDGTGKKKKK